MFPVFKDSCIYFYINKSMKLKHPKLKTEFYFNWFNDFLNRKLFTFIVKNSYSLGKYELCHKEPLVNYHWLKWMPKTEWAFLVFISSGEWAPPIPIAQAEHKFYLEYLGPSVVIYSA